MLQMAGWTHGLGQPSSSGSNLMCCVTGCWLVGVHVVGFGSVSWSMCVCCQQLHGAHQCSALGATVLIMMVRQAFLVCLVKPYHIAHRASHSWRGTAEIMGLQSGRAAAGQPHGSPAKHPAAPGARLQAAFTVYFRWAVGWSHHAPFRCSWTRLSAWARPAWGLSLH